MKRRKIHLTYRQTPSVLIDWYLKSRITQLKLCCHLIAECFDNPTAKGLAGKQINIQKQYISPPPQCPLECVLLLQNFHLVSHNLFVNNFGDIWWFLGKEKLFSSFQDEIASYTNAFSPFYMLFFDTQSSRYIVILFLSGDIKSILLIYLKKFSFLLSYFLEY